MIEKYKKIPDLPTGSPMDDDLIPFVKLSTNQTMKASKASLMGAQAIAVAFVDNDMVFTLTNGMTISLSNAKLSLRGEAGDEVQLRKTSTHLQWKLIESAEWTDIVSLSEITGPKGDVGAKIVGAGFNGNDLVFILDDASTVTIVNGRLAIKGDKGDTGDAGSVTIGTVTTLPAGSPATVENTGTEKDAILNFGIPEGHDGDMQKSTYDPNNKNDDAFDMDNMSEGATNKILTASERANFHAPGSDDQDLSGLISKSIGTAEGDIIIFSENGTPIRLGKGEANQILAMKADGSRPEWKTQPAGADVLQMQIFS
jgi:uncharacterized cupin superfamily protein